MSVDGSPDPAETAGCRGRSQCLPDEAASEIVGNVLMIAVSVLLASALGYSLASVAAPGDPVSAEFVVEDGAELQIRHAGGEGVPVDGPTFVLLVDGDEERHPLSDFSDDVSAGNPGFWEIGERVCLSCQVGGTIETVTFVAEERVILDWERDP